MATKPVLTEAQKLRQKQKEARDLRAALQTLSDNVLLFLDALDKAMAGPEGPERGKRIAHLSNQLDLVNDGVRYNALGVDFRKDDKPKAVAALRKVAKA